MNAYVLRQLVRLGVWWIRRQERRVLDAGEPLTPAESADARRVGVQAPERVRVQHVRRIPAGLPVYLSWLAPGVRFALRDTLGMALGHAVYVRRDYAGDRELLAHELVHVAQYERLGTHEEFLRRYLLECIRPGYPQGPLEIEASTKARAVVVSFPSANPEMCG